MRLTHLNLMPRSLAIGLVTCCVSVLTASADIYEWEYIDPLQPELGKQESTTLVPGGAGVDAVPWADLRLLNLNKAYFIGADLTGTRFYVTHVFDADFTDAILGEDTSLPGATSYGFTQQHLMSTASYKAGDLSGVILTSNIMSGWDFTGQIMTDVNFYNTNLSGALFTNANLMHVYFEDADLTGGDFTGATINYAHFYGDGGKSISKQQFMSTASYQSGDLSGLRLWGNHILDATDFSGMVLAGSYLSRADLAYSNFTNADLQDVNFTGSYLAYADFQGANTVGANFNNANLAYANLSGRNLAGSDMSRSILESTNLTGADISGADLSQTTASGFTYVQLLQTVNGQNGDLAGVGLADNDLSNWYFSGTDLSGSNLDNTIFAGADLSGADLTNSSARFASLAGANMNNSIITGVDLYGAEISAQQLNSTWNYQNESFRDVDFGQLDLTGVNLNGFDLSGTSYFWTDLSEVDLTDADISRSNLNRVIGLSEMQLASTYNYKQLDLSGINFGFIDMSGWRFVGQDFGDANLSGGVFANSDLKYTNMLDTGVTRGINLYGADIRGGVLPSGLGPPSRFYETRNMINSDGSIVDGLDVWTGESIWIRDDDGGPTLTPIPITVQNSFDIEPDATLRFLIEDPSWGSTISFDNSVGTAYLAGTLELAMKLDEGLMPVDLLGATFDLFDWTGVTIDGAFDHIVLDPAWHAAGLSLDVSQLMTTGEVRVVPLIGDLNADGFVGIDDLNIILVGWNQAVTPGDLFSGDLDGDGFIGIADLNLVLGTWNTAVPPADSSGAAVPEPVSAILLGLGGLTLTRCRS